MRHYALAAPLSFIAACTLAACTNGGGLGSIGGTGGGGGSPSPLPSAAIGVDLPQGKIGVENDPVWGIVGGYTESQTSQVLAFPPGSVVTIQNLSMSSPHTLNVIGVTKGPPPNWPKNPSLSFSPSGNGVLGAGYASGSLNTGTSVKVKLTKPGIYLIGCAYHYLSNTMRGVIQVVAGATPGPTASPGSGSSAGLAPSRTIAATASPAERRQLIDQRGRRFTLASLRGEPLVITFVSAHCTDACPLINGQFAQAARRLKHGRIAARLLTITLDPEHDSPQTMRELALRFDADPRYWLLAGGSVRNVDEIMRRFNVISVEGERGYRDSHTTFVYIINSSGALEQTLLASTALDDDVIDALRAKRSGGNT
jgi:protein SCO1/2